MSDVRGRLVEVIAAASEYGFGLKVSGDAREIADEILDAFEVVEKDALAKAWDEGVEAMAIDFDNGGEGFIKNPYRKEKA